MFKHLKEQNILIDREIDRDGQTDVLYHQLHRDSDACLGHDLADLGKK